MPRGTKWLQNRVCLLLVYSMFDVFSSSSCCCCCVFNMHLLYVPFSITTLTNEIYVYYDIHTVVHRWSFLLFKTAAAVSPLLTDNRHKDASQVWCIISTGYNASFKKGDLLAITIDYYKSIYFLWKCGEELENGGIPFSPEGRTRSTHRYSHQ